MEETIEQRKKEHADTLCTNVMSSDFFSFYLMQCICDVSFYYGVSPAAVSFRI
jgi:hypothetical protein